MWLDDDDEDDDYYCYYDYERKVLMGKNDKEEFPLNLSSI